MDRFHHLTSPLNFLSVPERRLVHTSYGSFAPPLQAGAEGKTLLPIWVRSCASLVIDRIFSTPDRLLGGFANPPLRSLDTRDGSVGESFTAPAWQKSVNLRICFDLHCEQTTSLKTCPSFGSPSPSWSTSSNISAIKSPLRGGKGLLMGSHHRCD